MPAPESCDACARGPAGSAGHPHLTEYFRSGPSVDGGEPAFAAFHCRRCGGAWMRLAIAEGGFRWRRAGEG